MVDKICSMAKRNDGIYEPERRLTLMAIATVLSTTAFVGLGISAAVDTPAFPLALELVLPFRAPFASQAIYTYVTACHLDDANQTFATIGLVKTSLTFASSTLINGWFNARGPRNDFWIIAASFDPWTLRYQMRGGRFLASIVLSLVIIPFKYMSTRLRRTNLEQKYSITGMPEYLPTSTSNALDTGASKHGNASRVVPRY
ncbi:hypothetical protein F5884DRAFT_875510 [Xylogone sp. PMI_703]|nr:hypothetical protein F5884DRAFT_875510 [Xylogone sp. PMI_703]